MLPGNSEFDTGSPQLVTCYLATIQNDDGLSQTYLQLVLIANPPPPRPVPWSQSGCLATSPLLWPFAASWVMWLHFMMQAGHQRLLLVSGKKHPLVKMLLFNDCLVHLMDVCKKGNKNWCGHIVTHLMSHTTYNRNSTLTYVCKLRTTCSRPMHTRQARVKSALFV